MLNKFAQFPVQSQKALPRACGERRKALLPDDWLTATASSPLSLAARILWVVSRAPCPVPTTSIYLSTTSHYTPHSPISIWTCPFCGIKNWYSSWCRLICRELPLFFVSTPPHPLMMMLLLHGNGSLKTCPNIHCRRVSTSNGRRRRGEEGAIRRWWNRQKGGAQTTLKHWTTDSIKDMSACTAARWQQYVTINLIGIDEKFTWSTACPVLNPDGSVLKSRADCQVSKVLAVSWWTILHGQIKHLPRTQHLFSEFSTNWPFNSPLAFKEAERDTHGVGNVLHKKNHSLHFHSFILNCSISICGSLLRQWTTHWHVQVPVRVPCNWPTFN